MCILFLVLAKLELRTTIFLAFIVETCKYNVNILFNIVTYNCLGTDIFIPNLKQEKISHISIKVKKFYFIKFKLSKEEKIIFLIIIKEFPFLDTIKHGLDARMSVH